MKCASDWFVYYLDRFEWASATQQSVQQTAGSLRDLEAFSWLRAYTALSQFSRQPLLTQTVGPPLLIIAFFSSWFVFEINSAYLATPGMRILR